MIFAPPRVSCNKRLAEGLKAVRLIICSCMTGHRIKIEYGHSSRRGNIGKRIFFTTTNDCDAALLAIADYFYLLALVGRTDLRTTNVVPVCSASKRAFSEARNNACGAFCRSGS